MISLDILRQALVPLEMFGRDEHTFQINGLDITVRPLLPVEETQVQRYAGSVLEESRGADEVDDDGNLTRAAALDYFDRFRIEVLALAIVQIGTLNLRGVKTIATGEALPDGTPVQVTKGAALRDMIRSEWSRGALSIAFEAYGDLTQRLQDTIENITRKSIEDLDVEIARLESRLVEVREERAKRTVSNSTIFSNQIETLLQVDTELERQTERARAEIQANREQEMAATAPARRESVIPATAPPPGPVAAPAGNPAPQEPVVDGTTMRLPPQVLSNRNQAPQNRGPADLNPAPKGAMNPKYQPRRG